MSQNKYGTKQDVGSERREGEVAAGGKRFQLVGNVFSTKFVVTVLIPSPIEFSKRVLFAAREVQHVYSARRLLNDAMKV